MKVPPKVADRMDKWLSTKLGLAGGAIYTLKDLGMDPNVAGVCVVVVAGAFLLVVGIQEYQKAKVGGITLDEIKGIALKLKGELGEAPKP
jgi:hypothetical protein